MSVHLFVSCLLVCLSVYVSVHLFVSCLMVCLLSVYVYVLLFVSCLLVCLSMCLSLVCLSVCLSVCVCTATCLSVNCLSVCLSSVSYKHYSYTFTVFARNNAHAQVQAKDMHAHTKQNGVCRTFVSVCVHLMT